MIFGKNIDAKMNSVVDLSQAWRRFVHRRTGCPSGYARA
jgi:hypothetical protein